tara:strand:- start:6 stop:452 length:447 start_codon:yes stop_codon:yes gene_type:complete
MLRVSNFKTQKMIYLFIVNPKYTSRGGAAAARRAHNPKVTGSSPVPATKLPAVHIRCQYVLAIIKISIYNVLYWEIQYQMGMILDQNKEINMKFYNLKLKKSIEVPDKDVTLVTMKNGRPAGKAVATIDGAEYTMFRILSAADAAKLK